MGFHVSFREGTIQALHDLIEGLTRFKLAGDRGRRLAVKVDGVVSVFYGIFFPVTCKGGTLLEQGGLGCLAFRVLVFGGRGGFR